jgi:tetratricopeptide (TPR) repeat protein
VPAEHREALSRLLGAYVSALRAATDAFTPGGPRLTGPEALPVWEPPDTAAQAELVAKPLVWIGVERVNIPILIEQAYDVGLDDLAWLLAVEATEFFRFGLRFGDWANTHTLALKAARRAGNRLAEAVLLTGLAERDVASAFEDAFWRLDAPGFDPDGTAAAEASGIARDLLDSAAEQLGRCREVFAELGDAAGEARCLHGLADAARGRGEYEQALGCFEACLTLLRRTNARRMEAEVLVCLAMCHGDRGELDEGVSCLRAALTIARELRNTPLDAFVRRRLGDLYRHRGDPERALASYDGSLELLGGLPDAIWEPRILVRRGDILAELDDRPGALRSWRQAATLLRQTGSTELAVAEARLSGAATSTTTTQ